MTEQQLNEEDKQRLFAAELKRLALIDLSSYPYRTQEQIVGVFTREQLKEYLKTPEMEANQKALRKISRFLYNGSSHYKRLVKYFANMLTLDYYIEPYGFNPDKVNKKTLKSQYTRTVDSVEIMNIKHEFLKAQDIAYRDGIFYGYIHANKDSFFIQYLDAGYCKITFIEDGLFGFAFDFTYFKTYPERLNMFPDEFRQKYEELKNQKGKKPTYWINLDIQNTICLKPDESTWYPIPPFVGVFEDILNIADFKALQKTGNELENYKLLFQKIPIDEKNGEVNKFLIDMAYAKSFHDNIEKSLPSQVGIITSPMDVEDISFEKDTTDKNRVTDAIKQYWKNAGVSDMLFSGETTGSIGLSMSIKSDEAIAFSMLRQIERWINKYLKYTQSGTYKFRVKMPEITVFNRGEVQDQLLKNAQFGMPVKLQLISSMGLQPSIATNVTMLENDILNLTETFIPLSSSHTGGLNEGGRPTKTVKSDAGDKTADQNANQDGAM